MSTSSVVAGDSSEQPRLPLQVSQRQFWVALLCVAVAGAGISSTGPVFPPLARELQISEVTVGVIAGLAPLLFMIAAPVWGHVADRHGPKPVLIAGMIGHTVGAALFAFSAFAGLNFWVSGYVIIGILSVGRVLNGALGAGIFPAAVSTAAATVAGERRASAIAAISAAWGIGTMLGPALATASSSMGLYAPHVILTAVSFSAATLAFLVNPPAGTSKRAKPGRVLPPTDVRIRPFVLITGASYAVIVEVNVVLGFSIQDALHLDAVDASEAIGVMFTTMGLFSLFAQMVLVRLKRVPPSHAMRIGIAIVVAGLFGLVVADRSIVFGMACAAIGLGFGLVGPTTSAACSLALSSEEQGSGAGWMSSARSVGSIVGAWSGGMLYAFSPQAPYTASVVVALGIAALMLFHPRVRASRRD